METLKVCLASDWCYPGRGGVEIHVRKLAQHLVRKGHEVEIVTKNGFRPPSDSIPTHMLKGGVYKKHGVVKDPRALTQLRRILEKGDYDIVHGHGVTSPISLAACLLARRGETAVLTNHSLLGGARPNFLVPLVLRPLVSQVDAVIAVSSSVKEETESFWNGPVEVIPNGTAMGKGKASSPAEPTVSTVSRLVKRKNIADIVKVAPSLVEDFPGLEFKVIGGGPEKKRVRAEVAARGLEEHFQLLGALDPPEVEGHLGGSTVFVHPADFEAFSISVLEAMACGVPVVVKNHGGVSDFVVHGKNGFLVDNRDDLKRYTFELLRDEKKRRRMASEAKKTASRFDWARVTDDVLDVYWRAMNRKP